MSAGAPMTFTATDDTVTFAGGVNFTAGSDWTVNSGGGAISVTGVISATPTDIDVAFTSTGGSANTISFQDTFTVRTLAVTAMTSITLLGSITTADTPGNSVTFSGPVLMPTWDIPITTDNATNAEAAGSPSSSPSASPAGGRGIAPVELASGPVRDWDARWDETGTHLAVWVATTGDPRIGDLTLYSVDAATGRVQTLNRVPALAGFSIGKGRLAWATPRGQDGQGSRLQVVAWTKDSVGSVESRESTEVLVVIR
jgi:hypothetical protein